MAKNIGIVIDYKSSFEKLNKKHNYPKAERLIIWGSMEKENYEKNPQTYNPIIFWFNFWMALVSKGFCR